MMTKEVKVWYKSKSKWAGILAGISLIMPGLIAWLEGGVFPMADLWMGATAVLAVFGLRDLPFVNK